MLNLFIIFCLSWAGGMTLKTPKRNNSFSQISLHRGASKPIYLEGQSWVQSCRETAEPLFGKEKNPDKNGTSTKTLFGGRGKNLVKRFATDKLFFTPIWTEKVVIVMIIITIVNIIIVIADYIGPRLAAGIYTSQYHIWRQWCHDAPRRATSRCCGILRPASSLAD